MTLLKFDYPITATFRMITLSPEVQVKNAGGELLMQVKQKLLTLREATTVYADLAKTQPLYHIKADRITGFRAVHRITRASSEQVVGSVKAVGLRSLWKTHYDVTDAQERPVFYIQEENPWTKFLDGLLGEIPLIGFIIASFIQPSYLLKDSSDTAHYRITKRRSLLERNFTLEHLGTTADFPAELVALALIQTIFLERNRG